MTREELSELRDNYKNDDQVVEILFDKLNDIERRICENCKHSIESDDYYVCTMIGLTRNSDWYCADFEVESK